MITYDIQFRYGYLEGIQGTWCGTEWRDYSNHQQALAIYQSMTGPGRAYFDRVLPPPQDIRIVKVERHYTYRMDLEKYKNQNYEVS